MENPLRYMALGLLIVLGMYLIVSLVGAAETVITGVDKKAEENRIEDGQFGVFVPLTGAQEENLREQGITLERMFYLDFVQEGENTLRVFKNRESINLTELDGGRPAENENEAVLEKRYCEENNIHIGDSIEIGSGEFQVVGIGSVPDYDAMYRSLTDSSVESKQFGLAFVDAGAYERLKDSGSSMKSEEYNYAYRLNGSMTDNELKDKIRDMQLQAGDVEDEYFQEYWKETAGKKDELKDGLQELIDGAEELNEGLLGLDGNADILRDGAADILDAYLKEAGKSLSEYGLTEELTEENYAGIIETLKEGSDNAVFKLSLSSVLEQLNKLKDYKYGIALYTDKVAEAFEGSGELSEGFRELKDNTDELLDKYFDTDISNLTQFMKASENPRIKASADDQVINKVAGLIAGIIAMILFTYVISVFVIHGIEKESSVIGSLYALGVTRRELMLHYLMLPVAVTFLAGLIGTAAGFSRWGINYQMQDCYDYFSVPMLQTAYPAWLVVYGIVMPPVAAAAVNCIVIWKRLSQPALKLIRNEQKTGRIGNINLGNMGFIGRFRVRQMLRESRTGFTVIFGMFISLLIMMLGIDCYVMCRHISEENKADTKYGYMYTYKYPGAAVPDGGEAAFAKNLKKEIYGYNLDVTLLGIEKENPYFDADVTEGQNKVIISTAMSQKYHLSEGEQLVLTDAEEEIDYAFTVTGVTQYSAGMYVFMDIDSMRELFGMGSDYYNVVFSDDKLDIEPGRLYATTTKEEISKSSDIFISKMMPMIYMMTSVSALIFCMVMYLMLKVMIDRSAFGISLIKIFGYRTGEIRKLYLNGNFYIVAVGAAVGIPLAKKMMDILYPLLVSNVSCAMNLTFSWQLYVGIYGVIICMYFLISRLLVRKLKKLVPADVLKNRE